MRCVLWQSSTSVPRIMPVRQCLALVIALAIADSIVDGWMHSPGHRKNVLSSAFEEVGVAVAPASPQKPFNGPTVVALYGVTSASRADASAPCQGRCEGSKSRGRIAAAP